MRLVPRWSVLVGLALLAVAVGCARVDVRKVPARSDYREWDDSKQAAADAICGIRYYMPRPYLSTARAMIVGGGDYFISGKVVGGQLVSVSTASIPAPIRSVFPVSSDGTALIAASSIHVRRSGRPFVSESTGGGGVAPTSSSSTPSASAPVADVVEPKKAPALGVKFDRATFAPTTQTVQLTATLAVSPGFSTVDELTPVLLPVVGDQVSTSGVVVLPATSTTPYVASKGGDDKGTAGACSTSIRRSDVSSAPHWVAGLRFTGKSSGADAATRTYLYYNPDEWLSVAGAVASKPQGGSAPGKESESTREGEGDPAKTTADFVGSGDPQTNPVLKLNDAFEIVYLPDFDQQYAIDVQGGLGQAKSKVALENGWMLERSETAIDNRELGKFVFKQIEKFTDIAAELARARLLPTLDTAEGAQESGLVDAAGAFRPEATGPRGSPSQVLLRVHYVLEAQPGVYPILKPGEVEAWKRLHAQARCEQAASGVCVCERNCSTGDTAVYVPCPPFTVVAKDVYRRVVVELVGVTTSSPTRTGAPRRDSTPEDAPKELTTLVDRWLGELAIGSGASARTAAAVLGEHRLRLTRSTTSPGAIMLEVAYRKDISPDDIAAIKAVVSAQRPALQKAIEDAQMDFEVLAVGLEPQKEAGK